MLRRILVVMMLSAALSSCSQHREDLKSPCVGTDDSPCGPKRAVNQG
jgi:hypothetical protein